MLSDIHVYLAVEIFLSSRAGQIPLATLETLLFNARAGNLEQGDSGKWSLHYSWDFGTHMSNPEASVGILAHAIRT